MTIEHHGRDGLIISAPDAAGPVTITHRRNEHAATKPTFATTMTRDAWAAVVAALDGRGPVVADEESETVYGDAAAAPPAKKKRAPRRHRVVAAEPAEA